MKLCDIETTAKSIEILAKELQRINETINQDSPVLLKSDEITVALSSSIASGALNSVKELFINDLASNINKLAKEFGEGGIEE